MGSLPAGGKRIEMGMANGPALGAKIQVGMANAVKMPVAVPQAAPPAKRGESVGAASLFLIEIIALDENGQDYHVRFEAEFPVPVRIAGLSATETGA